MISILRLVTPEQRQTVAMNESLLIAPVAGLLGVFVGAALTTLKDVLLLRLKDKKDAEYLAVRVVCLLERFAENCALVAEDDGEEDERGRRHTVAASLAYDIDHLSVEWKSIPVSLAYDLLNFAAAVETESKGVSEAADEAEPPGYEEYYDARQWAGIRLGVKAISLADTLRKRAKLPKSNAEVHQRLERRRRELEAWAEQRERTRARILATQQLGADNEQ